MKKLPLFMTFCCICLAFLQGQAAIAENNETMTAIKNKGESTLNMVSQVIFNEGLDLMTGEPVMLKQRLDSTISRSFNAVSSQWTNSEKNVFAYDANGSITSELSYQWDNISGQWLLQGKYEYLYNATGNITELIQSEWNKVSGQWVEVYKSVYDYNTANQKTLFSGFEWNAGTSQWVQEDREQYIYDSTGLMIHFFDYNWNQSSQQWLATSREDFSYNPAGKVIQLLGYDWNSNTSQWVDDDKKTFSYDNNQNLTLLTDYYWDEVHGQYIFQDKQEFTYNAQGNVSQLVSFIWDKSTAQWKHDGRYESTFNNSHSYNELILPPHWFANLDPALKSSDFFYQKESFLKNMLSGFLYKTWNSTTSQWVDEYDVSFYYSQVNIGISEYNPLKVSVFPNPANDLIIVECQNDASAGVIFELFDLQGKKVLSAVCHERINRIPVSFLVRGTYLYNLKSQENQIKGKIIVE